MENIEKQLTLKQKILTTIFYLSFIPYIIFIIYSMISIIFGVYFLFSYVKGIDALMVMAIVALMYSPLFIACLIYQIIFKIKTKNKPEYKQYNLRKFILITSLLTVIGIVSLFVYNTVYNLHTKFAFTDRGYNQSNTLVIKYNDDYSNYINKAISMDYDDFFTFLVEHEDLHEYSSEYEDYYTNYTVIVSNILNNNVEIVNKPKIEISDGKETNRVTIDYRNINDKEDKNKYIVICIIDSLIDSYNTEVIWNTIE